MGLSKYLDLGLEPYLVVSLNYCSQNGNGNPNIGPRIMGNLDQNPLIRAEFFCLRRTSCCYHDLFVHATKTT